MKLLIIVFFLFTNQLVANAGELYSQFPDNIHPNEKYVFYSHGYIVEGNDPTPTHPRFGLYQFPDIKKALSSAEHNLIAYHRAAKTNPKEFAHKIATDVKKLMEQGVLAKNITLIGFSRGGFITAQASSLLNLKQLNTILLASCGRWVKNRQDIMLSGKVLSIYETSDQIGSCQNLIDRSIHVTSFKELAISTGKEHGAFFTPRKEWLAPVLKWIHSTGN